ncbi:MAG: Ig-like domain-containing protein, partial [Microcoleaceae cyanobacterium]
DRLFGENGDDTVGGNFGADQLVGGDGRDSFYYELPGEGVDIFRDFDGSNVDVFLFKSANFGNLTNPPRNSTFSSIVLTNDNIGSQKASIEGQELIIFQSSFKNVQVVNSILANQNGSGSAPAFFVYINEEYNKVVLGYDPNVSDDFPAAYNLGIIETIPISSTAINTIIDTSDFKFI